MQDFQSGVGLSGFASGALLPRSAFAFVRHSSAARMCLRKTGPFGKHFFAFFRIFLLKNKK
ncbi:hypothetical protein DESPIG_00103 [Desulfovibrio piger ATCC 29098]|uniref:Uncharacterized protein n=1 Tax=Desulfovibrio piger ATCC 29098 TaxID=411464 RepID=B6WPY0_9BACT|nr:hypothetical protein DESPIG_00103 [Desulfovibrio piger ATCC 29098]